MKEDLIHFLKQHSEREIYYKYLIGQEVWYFKNDHQDHSNKYDDFKKFISNKLDIPFNNIAIVGSAKTKFSFSPYKNFKEFGSDSDLDLIIVSKYYYKKIWAAYRRVANDSFLHNGFVAQTYL